MATTTVDGQMRYRDAKGNDYLLNPKTTLENVDGIDEALSEKSDTGHTHAAFTGATSSKAGAAGFVPAPTTSDTAKYLKGDGTWSTTPTTTVATSITSSGTNPVTSKAIYNALSGKSDTSHTHSAFTGATSSSAGAAGFVPAPGTSDRTKYLKGDGTWTAAPTTTVDSSLSSSSTNPVQNKAVYNALAGKAASSHTHDISDVTDLESSLQRENLLYGSSELFGDDFLLIDNTILGAANRTIAFVATSSAKNAPVSGTFLGVRKVYMISPDHFLVEIAEAYPNPSRTWRNFYNISSWSGWVSTKGS
jgi:hypothetical protein